MLESIQSRFREHENDPNSRLTAFTELQQQIMGGSSSAAADTTFSYHEKLTLLSIGVLDPWSRIRGAAIKAISKLVSSHQPNISHTDNSEEACSIGVQSELLEFLESFIKKFDRIGKWYEKEGTIKLLSALGVWSGDDAFSEKVTNNVALPSLHASELPVREAASVLLAEIAKRHAELMSSVKCKLFAYLQLQSLQSKPSDIHSLEGHLLALGKIESIPSIVELQEDELAVLVKLSAHAAASVRMYVAEILRPPSEFLFGFITEEAIKLSMEEHVERQWEFYETVMMMLNNHLMYYLTHRCISFSRSLSYFSNFKALNLQVVSQQIIIALLRGIDSSVFEMNRIATQVLPHFVQFFIRHVGSVQALCDLYHALKKNCPVSLRNNKSLSDVFDQHTLPLMWWYLAIFVVVRRNPLRQLEQKALRKNLKLKLYRNTLRTNPATARIVFMIMSTYFSEWCAEDIVEEMLRPEAWKSILERNARKYIHFGVDFVLMMNHLGRDITHLVPVWADGLRNLMSHEQCIVLTMIKDALQPRSNAYFFSFAYDFTFKAPVMVDGGEDTTLGYTWLLSSFPTVDHLPLLKTLSPNAPARRSFSLEPTDTSLSCLKGIFFTLYTSSGTEPSVLEKIQDLMIVVLTTVGNLSWHECILEAVFTRLNTIAPNWQESSNTEEQTVTDDDDDWDADDECVGSSVIEEKEHALRLCKTVVNGLTAYSGKYNQEISLLLSHFAK